MIYFLAGFIKPDKNYFSAAIPVKTNIKRVKAIEKFKQ